MGKNKKTGTSTHNELVQCDLEFPLLQDQLADLSPLQFDQLIACVEKIQKMTWTQIYATSSHGPGKRGLNWEILKNQKTASGGTIASIRVTDKFRARVARDGVFMRFISLHPDHDSAYRGAGGEEI